MRTKDIVCPYELALALQDAGLPQRSKFCYVNHWHNARGPINDGEHIIASSFQLQTRFEGRKRGTEVSFTSTFTATELLSYIPFKVEIKGNVGYLVQYFPITNHRDYVMEYKTVSGKLILSITCVTELEARAKMLLYLIEYKHVTFQQTKEYETTGFENID